MDDVDDRILHLRLTGLRTNLELVKMVKAAVNCRRDEVRGLLDIFDVDMGIKERLGYVRNAITQCQEQVTKLDPELLPVVPIRMQLDFALGHLTTLAGLAEAPSSMTAAMGRRWNAIPSDGFDRHVDEIFKDQAQKLIDTIDKLRDVDPVSAWKTYREELRGQSEELFSEYVDFLGGLALRDTGLGRIPRTIPGSAPPESDVYHMADELIKQILYIGGTNLWHSLAIPARREAANKTLARMIRLGFPEWTAWAVPLAAFEFGRVVVDVNGLVGSVSVGDREVTPGLAILLADAFATYTMGPSYAYASVLTRLEPAPPLDRIPDPDNGPDYPKSLTDQDRFRVICSMLRLMDQPGDVYGPAVKDLENLWRVAAENVGAGAALADGDDHIQRWTQHMLEFLDAKAASVKYDTERYQTARTWDLVQLAAPERIGSWRMRPGEQDVRDILNAAWYGRIQDAAPPQETLAGAAVKLWRQDMESHAPAGNAPIRRGAGR